MTPIQIILLFGLASAAALTVARWRREDLRPGAALWWLAIWATGAVFTLAPEWSNTIAHKLHVGRGADLITYVSIVFLLFAVFRLVVRTERQRRELTELVRRLALDEQLKKDAERTASPSNPHA